MTNYKTFTITNIDRKFASFLPYSSSLDYYPASTYLTFTLDVSYGGGISGIKNTINCVDRQPFNTYRVDDQIEIDLDEACWKESNHIFGDVGDTGTIRKVSQPIPTFYSSSFFDASSSIYSFPQRPQINIQQQNLDKQNARELLKDELNQLKEKEKELNIIEEILDNIRDDFGELDIKTLNDYKDEELKEKIFEITSIERQSNYIRFHLDSYVRYSDGRENYINCVDDNDLKEGDQVKVKSLDKIRQYSSSSTFKLGKRLKKTIQQEKLDSLVNQLNGTNQMVNNAKKHLGVNDLNNLPQIPSGKSLQKLINDSNNLINNIQPEYNRIQKALSSRTSEQGLFAYVDALNNFHRIKRKLGNSATDNELQELLTARRELVRIQQSLNNQISDEELNAFVQVKQKFPQVQNELDKEKRSREKKEIEKIKSEQTLRLISQQFLETSFESHQKDQIIQSWEENGKMMQELSEQIIVGYESQIQEKNQKLIDLENLNNQLVEEKLMVEEIRDRKEQELTKEKQSREQSRERRKRLLKEELESYVGSETTVQIFQEVDRIYSHTKNTKLVSFSNEETQTVYSVEEKEIETILKGQDWEQQINDKLEKEIKKLKKDKKELEEIAEKYYQFSQQIVVNLRSGFEVEKRQCRSLENKIEDLEKQVKEREGDISNLKNSNENVLKCLQEQLDDSQKELKETSVNYQALLESKISECDEIINSELSNEQEKKEYRELKQKCEDQINQVEKYETKVETIKLNK